jgi:hypothetical protein
MEDQDQMDTQEVNPELKEAFETVSPDTENFDEVPFVPPVVQPMVQEVFQVGDTKVVFREPTEAELPTKPVPNKDQGIIGQDFFGTGEDWQATSIGESPGGARLQVTKKPEGTGYILSWRDGGELPMHLRGWYTSYDRAEVAARGHLATLWEKARKEA